LTKLQSHVVLTVETRSHEHAAKTIDHALLRPELTKREIRARCALALRSAVAPACVRPCDGPLASELLAGSTVAVATVVGFPHGSSSTATKVFEARKARADAAAELYMVVKNIGWLRSGHTAAVGDDTSAVVEAAGGATITVIFANADLTDDERVRGCRLA